MGCLQEIPHLRRVYARHREQGLEILGIAFVEGDEKGKRWLTQFLDEREVTWPQVPTRPEWYAAPFEAYDVHYIPFNVLIDPQGRVVAIDLRGERLDRLLQEKLGDADPTGAAPAAPPPRPPG